MFCQTNLHIWLDRVTQKCYNDNVGESFPRKSKKESDTIMYTKDKAHRITLRLNDNQFNFVKDNADMLDVSPSEFLRMVVNANIDN